MVEEKQLALADTFCPNKECRHYARVDEGDIIKFGDRSREDKGLEPGSRCGRGPGTASLRLEGKPRIKEKAMEALVVYDSQYGNTERVARTVADGLREVGRVRLVCLDPVSPIDLRGVDMLVVGCPTQGWRSTPAMQSFLEGVLFREAW